MRERLFRKRDAVQSIARIFATGLLRLHQHHLLDLPDSSEQSANGVDCGPETSVTVLPASQQELSPKKGTRR